LLLRSKGVCTSPHDRAIVRACHKQVHARRDFPPDFFLRISIEQGEQSSALALDFARSAFGLMICGHCGERRLKLLAGAGVLPVHDISLAPPAAGDFANRQAVMEPQAEQFYATQCGLACFLCGTRLPLSGLPKHGTSPGAVEGDRDACLVIGDLLQIGFTAYALRWPSSEPRLSAQRNNADGTTQKGAESSWPTRLKPIKQPTGPKALGEDLLGSVIEFLKLSGAAPPGGKVGAHDRLVTPGEQASGLAMAVGRVANYGPASRFICCHDIAPHARHERLKGLRAGNFIIVLKT
jgi:hypothetical protein